MHNDIQHHTCPNGLVLLGEASLEEIIQKASGPLLNAAAQAWNHEFFWSCLSPTKSKPSKELVTALEASFGSVETFQ